jgi:gamma-glutamyltranspeptidase/glutathione hydrolase
MGYRDFHGRRGPGAGAAGGAGAGRPRRPPQASWPIISEAARVHPALAPNGMVASQEGRADAGRRGDSEAAAAMRWDAGGGGRLCASGDAAARRQSRRRRLHAGASGGAQRDGGHRLSRGGAKSGDADHVPRRQWRAGPAALPRFRPRGRRAGGRWRASPRRTGATAPGGCRWRNSSRLAISMARDGIMVDEDLADSLPRAAAPPRSFPPSSRGASFSNPTAPRRATVSCWCRRTWRGRWRPSRSRGRPASTRARRRRVSSRRWPSTAVS